eukprot:CAMPEP_0171256412 /NCGR_PEP_ID=MMETSP0790-20130122/53289_1 /TAXON_ID=2925 /ORGANISM="Alexandrium catenella, Strain OF101" /LENGTH=37 /DNA_ID= /DNA_START= /DNA_END= /DNA_ORIENTATION=
MTRTRRAHDGVKAPRDLFLKRWPGKAEDLWQHEGGAS